jgi:hypothetical protein
MRQVRQAQVEYLRRASISDFQQRTSGMAKRTASPKPPLDDLLPHITEIMTAMEDIESDIKARNKSMIGRYLKEADEHLEHAKKLFAKIIG